MQKKHIRDIRMYNNGGVSVPLCDKTGSKVFEFGNGIRETDNVTCKKCLKIFPIRYPWAVRTIHLNRA